MTYKYKEIGEILKKRRMELGKSVTTLAEETKVPERYLIAIEEGDLKEFHSSVYYDLFARSYSRELGIDDHELFESEKEPEPIPGIPGAVSEAVGSKEEKKIQNSERKGSFRSWLWLIAIILVGGGVTAFILLKGKTPQESERTQEPKPQVNTEVVVDTVTPPIEANVADSIMASTAQNPAMRLEVTVKKTCWVLIMADDDTAAFGSLQPGIVRNLTAMNKFVISAGNPSGVEFKLDDTLLKPLSPDGKPIRGLEISRANKEGFLSIPEDSTGGRR
jgi:transcriptional regulator with XRE-family HTH domain